MTGASPRDMSGLSSPDAALSEGHSSVQVNLDMSSQRGRSSIGGRSRSSSVRPSPSRGPERSLTRQATSNSASSFVSSQSSSQPSPGDPTPPEDVLRGLVVVSSEPASAAASAALHGVKRPHDDETADEPLAKRDRLGEELERMSALHPSAVPPAPAPAPAPALSAGSSAFSTSTTIAHPAPANGAAAILPIRPGRQRLPRLGNGTAISRNRIPEESEPPSPSDGNMERSFDHGQT
ncbi:uncharacterized protein P884DRAFT_45421 [Thermothelomyces heterothallicus CBS 202.75]|uniref:uncharacterized protein n=1 Tax=Thermothelomyces heterothallicus CBS 202.75 TaxID=1149848 RepID=UPI003742B518